MSQKVYLRLTTVQITLNLIGSQLARGGLGLSKADLAARAMLVRMGGDNDRRVATFRTQALILTERTVGVRHWEAMP